LSFFLGSLDYKFTGKQRDTETGLDYFGARYYDARIARWGGVEPLLNSYLSFSPYQYSVLNPIKYKDNDGRDAIVEIKDKEVTITVRFYYSRNRKLFNFSEQRPYNCLVNYINDAQREWNLAAEEYNKNSEYKIKFKIELKEINEISDSKLEKGENLAFYNENGNAPAIVDGRWLQVVPYIVDIDDDNYSLRDFGMHTGSHEIGHAMGLTHIGPVNSIEQLQSQNVMGYNSIKNPPDKDDVAKIVSKLDLNVAYQIITGDKTQELNSKY
jgi:RHS repeat-associated protein